MTARLLLYGATGRSGTLLAETLADLGAQIVLGGRDARRTAAVAHRLGLKHRVFDLAPDGAADHALADITMVLNAAGPFRETAPALIGACLRTRTHYCDLAGEWPVFVHAMETSDQAVRAGVLLMPGVGFGIAVTDSALALAAARAEAPVRLKLGLSRPHTLSRGSVATMIDLAPAHALERRGGTLRELPFGRTTHDFDFGDGPERATAVAWPDVVTAEFSTGVPNVQAFSCITAPMRMAGTLAAAAGAVIGHPQVKAALRRAGGLWPIQPDDNPAGFTVVAQAEDRWRRVSTVRLTTPDGYSTTTIVAAAIVRRLLSGTGATGFFTPSSLLGPEFVLTLPAAVREIGPPAPISETLRHAIR